MHSKIAYEKLFMLPVNEIESETAHSVMPQRDMLHVCPGINSSQVTTLLVVFILDGQLPQLVTEML